MMLEDDMLISPTGTSMYPHLRYGICLVGPLVCNMPMSEETFAFVPTRTYSFEWLASGVEFLVM